MLRLATTLKLLINKVQIMKTKSHSAIFSVGFFKLLPMILLSFCLNANLIAEEANNVEQVEQVEQVEDNRTTAEKLEDLKSEVLAVNRDLFILEEDLLFPASTQVAVYFSIDVGRFFSLDNIKLKIDDKQVSHHLYTEKDVSALLRGAIQKVFVGNITTGEHELVAIVIGKGPRKREYRKAVSFKFTKDTDAKALEIQLRDSQGKLQPKLKIVEW